MKISIVIPAYNEEALIGKCLRSIEAQISASQHNAEIQDVEIIVVDNGSTDGTRRVVSAFPYVKIVGEPRKGLSQARHAGFLAATGDLVANVDADNVLPAGWLHYALERFKQDPKLVALSGPLVYYDVSFLYRAVFRIFYIVGYACDRIVGLFSGSGAMLQGGNYVVRHSVMKAINGYDTSIKFYGEDVALARRITERRLGKIVWTFQFPMYSSGRRIIGDGLARLALDYALNYTWIILHGKPFTQVYTDVRLQLKEVFNPHSSVK